MHKVLFNGSATTVTVDDDGRQVGPGEWGVGDTTSEACKRSVARDAVSWLSGDLPDNAVPEAKAAQKLADELNSAKTSKSHKTQEA